MEMKKILILFTVLFISCNENPSTTSNQILDEGFLIRFGQQVSIPSENLLIKFYDLLDDSRCPINVICFWQGEATIELLISHEDINNIKAELKIEGYVDKSNTSSHKFIDTLGYRFTLMQLDPYPHTDSSYQKSDYVAMIKVGKK